MGQFAHQFKIGALNSEEDKQFALKLIQNAVQTETPTLEQLYDAMRGLRPPGPTNVGWGGPENSPEMFLLQERHGQSDKRAVDIPDIGEVSGQLHRDFQQSINYKGVDMDAIGELERLYAGGKDATEATATARVTAVYGDLMDKMKGSSLDTDQKSHALM